MENLMKFAIQYAERGFSVIPVLDKKPLVKFADRPAMTGPELKRFYLHNPYAGIALKTDQFFVIDVDRHPDGEDGTKAIKELGHPEWFQTLCQETAHHGFQFFYEKPAERVSQNIGFLPGVDIKAHKNNYVVVAPSKGYRWVNHRPMIKPAAGLLSLIEQQAQPSISEQELLSYQPSGPTQTSKLFEMIADGLGVTGGRNNALAAFAGGLLFRNVSPEATLALARIANAHTADQLSDREVVTTVNSMIKKELRRRGVSQ